MFHFLQKWDKTEVMFFSINLRNKNKPMTNGTLGGKYRTYVVEGNMLGEQYSLRPKKLAPQMNVSSTKLVLDTSI